MMICLEILLYYECSTVSNTFNVYQAFNFRKIKNLFVVSARFCEIYFILQVLLYTFKCLKGLNEVMYIKSISGQLPIRAIPHHIGIGPDEWIYW